MVMLRFAAFAFAASLIANAHAARAGVNVWTTHGPFGEIVQALGIDPIMPSTLYAGTYGAGVFRSTSGGTDWTAVNTGLTNTVVQALAIDPLTPSTLYAGTGGGVFRSTNSGGTWNETNFPGVPTFDPLTSSTLYAGSYGGGVFRSTNSGTDWTAVNTGLTNTVVQALTIDAFTPGTLYTGTGGGVFRSSNSGASWSAVNNGLTIYVATGVPVLAIDPHTPSRLYTEIAHGSDIGCGGEFFQSTDRGGSWSATGPINALVQALAFDPSNPRTLYAGGTGSCGYSGGVYQSTDSGASWTPINAGLSGNVLNVDALAIDPHRPSTLYAGTGDGVFSIELTCAVGTGTSVSCTESALDACLPGGAGFNGTLTFDCGPSPVTITVTSTKTIGADTSIDGGSQITISGGNSVGVFSVNAGVTFTVQNLTIANGSAPDGGGIRSEGTLTVTNSTFSGNSATLFDGGGNGGGIWNVGALTVTDSTFSDNSAPADGGGVWNLGTLTVTTSSFSGNSARDGGGIDDYGPLTVSNSSFSGNSAHGGGGAIAGEGDGTVTVTSSTFAGNSASGFSGGGAIWTNGTLDMSNSTLAGNSATGSRGGAICNSGTLTVAGSTFAGNTGKGEGGAGGAIYSGGTLTVTNSTFSGNSAPCHFVPIPACVGSDGGAIANAGSLTVTNSTFSGNSATRAGGAIDNTAACGDTGSAPCSATLTNTLVANSTSGGNCAGTITDGGHNLDSDGTCGVGPVVDPLLDSAGLAGNGGPTQTIALESGSPAINAGDETICTAPPVNNLDQRGYVRPGVSYANCSIGAYEYNASGPGVPTATTTPTPTATPTATLAPVPSATPTPPPTASPTPTWTPTATRSPLPSATVTTTPTPSPTKSPTRTPSQTPTNTPTATSTAGGGGGGGCTMAPGETSRSWPFICVLLPLGLLVRRRVLALGGSRFRAQGHCGADEVFDSGLAAGNVPVRCFGRVTVPVAEIVVAEGSPSAFDETQVNTAIS